MWQALKRATYPARRAIAIAICPSIARHAPKAEDPSALRWASDLLQERLPLFIAHLGPPLRRARGHPDDLWAWVALARRIGDQPAALAAAHGLDRPSFLKDKASKAVAARALPRLTELAKAIRGKDDAQTIGAAIDEIIRWKNIVSVRDAFNYHIRRPGHYYGDAEPYMEKQWTTIIWPIIKDSNFERTLEIACGHGRQTEYLRRRARDLHLVDVNESCIEACRRRFGDQMDGCRFHYHVTDGNHLKMIADDSITFVSSWDSMVHFDKTVVRDYVIEIARVLVPGGTAFLHHSNIGASRPNSEWTENHGTRGDMSAELFQAYAREAGLTIVFQRLSGTADGWGMDDLDCLSLVAKPCLSEALK
jgi:ubiquinone/menaquinone biosynthesis C-methylase UbiE